MESFLEGGEGVTGEIAPVRAAGGEGKSPVLICEIFIFISFK